MGSQNSILFISQFEFFPRHLSIKHGTVIGDALCGCQIKPLLIKQTLVIEMIQMPA